MKKKLIKATCLFISVLMISLSFVPVVFASNSAIDDARHSVVRVWVPGAGTGTGFIVAQAGTSTVLVTNFHVIAGADKVYILPSDVHGAWIEAQITYLQTGLDLAILTTTTGLSGRPVLPFADISNLRAADTVYALGFPGTADDYIDFGEYMPSSANDVTVTRGIVSSVHAVFYNTDAIQHDCYISHGNSGGPLLNEAGAVIGINTWGNPEPGAARSVNYAIHNTYIINAFNEFGIEYKTQGGFAGMDFAQLFSSYWWVLLIIAGVVVGLVLRQKRVAPAATAAATPVAPPRPVQPPMAQGMGYPAASNASSHLICSRGHFAGQTFPINGVLYIGRDPQRCQVVFPSDTRGISSMHCELRQQGSSIVIVDKGSTYGTFVAGGRKLNANESVQLRPGDSFYLADPMNEFKVL